MCSHEIDKPRDAQARAWRYRRGYGSEETVYLGAGTLLSAPIAMQPLASHSPHSQLTSPKAVHNRRLIFFYSSFGQVQVSTNPWRLARDRHTLLAVCLGGAQSRLNYDVVLEVRNSRRSDPTIWHPILAHRISSRFRLVPACPSLPHPALSCPTPSHSNSPHLTSLNRRRRALGRSRPS